MQNITLRRKAAKVIIQGFQAASHCKRCGGIGWISVVHDVSAIYGREEKQSFMKRCPECSGMLRADGAGFPPEFCDASISKFDFGIYGKDLQKLESVARSFVNDFENKWWNNGKGLFLCSRSPGSGKTFFACCLGRDVAVHGDHTVKFTTFTDYLEMRKKSFKSPPGAVNNEQDCEKYFDCDLLILDDLGAEKFSEFVDAEIFRLVNTRLSSGKVTIFTSNIQAEKLPYANRTISRILNTSLRVNMPEIDVRLKISTAKEEKFLEKILN